MNTHRLVGALLGCLLLSTQAGAYSPFGPRPVHPGWSPGVPYPGYPAWGGYRARPYGWPAPARRIPRPSLPVESEVPTISETSTPEPRSDQQTTSAPAITTKQHSTVQTDHKATFVARLRPLIEAENARLLRLRDRLATQLQTLDADGSLPDASATAVQVLARKYRVDGDPLTDAAARRELLGKVDAIPVSLALAQAANESAWGKSRFAREGNNLFGIWTYDKSKGIVPLRREAGKQHLVRKFDTEGESVRYYMFTLNSHPAYAALREIRAELRASGRPLDGAALAAGLTAYSAKGEEYVRLIRGMIRRLDLAAFDGNVRNDA